MVRSDLKLQRPTYYSGHAARYAAMAYIFTSASKADLSCFFSVFAIQHSNFHVFVIAPLISL